MNKNISTLSLPAQNQNFSFFPSYINHIYHGANPSVLLKFYQCCKYFYFKSKIIIAPNLTLKSWPEIQQIMFSFYDKPEEYDYDKFEKVWLTDYLRIRCCYFDQFESKFLTKIYRNNLKKLYINAGYTSSSRELSILCNSPDLTDVTLHTKVKNSAKEVMNVDEILILFPFVKNFEIFPSRFTLESFNKLLKFNFVNNFERLCFAFIRNEFDPPSLCKFLKKNFVDCDAIFSLHFDIPQLRHQLMPQVKEFMNAWKANKPQMF